MEEKKLTDELEEMYVSGKFNGEIIFNAIKTIYALQEKNAEQKAEIERLTERLDYFQKSSDYHEGNQKELEAKNAELQKQVDELTDKLGKVLSGIKADELLVAKGIEQTVKDTAKEIYFKVKHESGVELSFLNDLALWVKDRFGVAVEKWIKVDGAEVE